MHFSLANLISVLGLLGSVSAIPAGSVESENVRLFNGESSVDAVYSDVVGRSSKAPITPRQSNINCKGSAFCERLGGSCDDALRKVIAGNTYSTYDG